MSEPSEQPTITEPSKPTLETSMAEKCSLEEHQPQASENPQLSENPQTSENPQLSENPQTSENPQMSENQEPQASENPETSENLQMSENPETSENPSMMKPSEGDGNNSSFFSLKLGPASMLKHALAVLSDVELNPQGTAMIEVGSKGVEITVRTSDNKTLGFLDLKASGLVEFEFRQPLKRKMINVKEIAQGLNEASDNDIITIWHGNEPHQLFFEIGSKPETNFGVQLLDIDAEFEKVPNYSYVCECVVLCEDLLKTIEHAEAGTKQPVIIDVSEDSLIMLVGEESMQYNYDTKKARVRGMAPGQKHHAIFQWPYCEALRKASNLTKGLLLCLVTEPKECFMWRFNLQKLGDLVLIKDLVFFFPNSQATKGKGK